MPVGLYSFPLGTAPSIYTYAHTDYKKTKQKTISVFKLNFLYKPLVCDTGHYPILDNLNLVQNVLKLWPPKPVYIHCM